MPHAGGVALARRQQTQCVGLGIPDSMSVILAPGQVMAPAGVSVGSAVEKDLPTCLTTRELSSLRILTYVSPEFLASIILNPLIWKAFYSQR